jgi:SAM-dependent methyltransferase
MSSIPPDPTPPSESVCFDGQADTFEARAGLPPGLDDEVAGAILSLARDRSVEGPLLDVGAGTGSPGRALLRAGIPTVGLDLSLPMLRTFASRLGDVVGRWLLVQADGRSTWPLRDGSMGVILLSRSAHHLDVDRLVAECARVGRPSGSLVVLGRLGRGVGSIQESLRRRLQEILVGSGFAGRASEPFQKALRRAFVAAGARLRDEPVVVARHSVEESAAKALASWRGKEGLAGLLLDETMKASILDELEEWARANLGVLDRTVLCDRSYRLTVIEQGRP